MDPPFPPPPTTRAELLRLLAAGYALYAVACLVLGLVGCHEGWWMK